MFRIPAWFIAVLGHLALLALFSGLAIQAPCHCAEPPMAPGIPWTFATTITLEPWKEARYASIAVDAGGFIFVSDETSARVRKFTPQGRFVKDGPESGPGFLRPGRLVLKGEKLYLLDPQAGRLHMLSLSLEVLATFDLGDAIGGRASGVSSFDVTDDWKVYLSETMTSSVVRLDSEMRPEAGFGDRGSIRGLPGRPTTMASSPDGGFWVFDWTTGGVTRYDSFGFLAGVRAQNPAPRIISLRNAGALVMGCDMLSRKVLVFDGNGVPLGSLGIPVGPVGVSADESDSGPGKAMPTDGRSGAEPFRGIPRDLCCSGPGRLFVLVAGPRGHSVAVYGKNPRDGHDRSKGTETEFAQNGNASPGDFRVFLSPFSPPGTIEPSGVMTGPSMALILGLDPPGMVSGLTRQGTDLYLRGERVKNFDFEIDGDDAILFFDDPRAGSGEFPCQAKVVVNMDGIIRMGSTILGKGDDKSNSRAATLPQEKR